MKIAIFGGSFNPVHLGHLVAAREVINAGKVQEVWFVPAFKNPLKKGYRIEDAHRIKMLKLAVQGNNDFKVLEFEIENELLYTVDSVRVLKKRFPLHEFYWIIGSDLVYQLEQWKDIKRLIKEMHFIIVPILGEDLSRVKNNYWVKKNKAIIIEHCIKTNISSTEIRHRVKIKKEFKHLVPATVYEYIKKQRLYC